MPSREVCDVLGLRCYQLEYIIRTGQLARPRLIGGRRFFDVEQIERIKRIRDSQK